MSTRSLGRITFAGSALLAFSMLPFAGLAGTAFAQAPASTAPAAAAPASSAKPDLNGTWKFNTTKSEMSPAPTPDAQTEVITVAGDTLTVAVTSSGGDGKQKFTYSLKIGAAEVPFPKAEVNESPLSVVSLKAEWKGASLIVSENITYEGGPGTMISTYTLSGDGKTLTKVMDASISQGNFQLKAVYDKA
jgi:hypothetical protein